MYKCPVCEKHEFELPYDICPVCGWENDDLQNIEPDYKGGANHISLNEARAQYMETKTRLVKRGYQTKN